MTKINKKEISKKRLVLNLITIIFLLGFIASTVSYIIFKIDEENTKKQLKMISNIVEVNQIDDNGELVEDYTSNEYLMTVNYDKLKEINPDIRGWIVVNGTNINYPFVQAKDNKYYLKHSFDKSSSRAGWVFLDYKNDINEDKNLVIYAHNMRNKTMFGSLKYILNKEWLNDSNNHIIKLSTETENQLWQVFSIYHIERTSDYIKTSFKSNSEYKSFLNMISKRSIHNFHTSVNTEDKILTLSTCYSTSQRLVLHAKLIKSEPKK